MRPSSSLARKLAKRPFGSAAAAASLRARKTMKAPLSRSPGIFPTLLSSASPPVHHHHYHQTVFLSSSSSSTTSSFPSIDDGAGQPALLTKKRNGVHDLGGLEALLGQQIDLSDPTLQDWEQETHALLVVLIQNGYLYTDELRRHIESMPTNHYVARGYYCKWAYGMALALIERGILDYTDLDRVLLGDNNNYKNISGSNTNSKSTEPAFEVGQRVRVLSEQSMARWRQPHLRSPGYIFGVHGIVESVEGYFPDPSYKAFRSMMMPEGVESAIGEERKEHLYRVRFQQEDIWPEGKDLVKNNRTGSDTVTVEIYENWLVDDDESSDATSWEIDPTNSLRETYHSHTDGHHHQQHQHQHHHHDHDHDHLPRAELEQRAIDLEVASGMCGSGSINYNSEPTTVVGDRLSAALIELLSKPQHIGPDLRMKLRKVVDALESVKVRADGATLVVKAWMDEKFEERLLDDAASAAQELGIKTVNATAPTKLKVVKSLLPTQKGPGVHNLITCTLCSCYPLSLLGLSPKWYKSRTYRARAVREPRAMLQDSFGLKLSPHEWTIRVHDSTADCRYLVLPPRPQHTEDWNEEELRQLVTRDTMIGVALPDGIIQNT